MGGTERGRPLAFTWSSRRLLSEEVSEANRRRDVAERVTRTDVSVITEVARPRREPTTEQDRLSVPRADGGLSTP
ncbi:hypothetical protein [Haladaptatus halobius]|uniref:hypothetical protein n=1 Tax=Haladaptatus halobius TaxID=2884875 RepID=UPI001D0BC4B4|nr:hypothetical protein [Haladaptatus halobius]